MVSIVEFSRRTSQRSAYQKTKWTESGVVSGVGRRRQRPLNWSAKVGLVSLVAFSGTSTPWGANKHFAFGFSPGSRRHAGTLLRSPKGFPTASTLPFQRLLRRDSPQRHESTSLEALPLFLSDVTTLQPPVFLHHLFNGVGNVNEMALNANPLSLSSMLESFKAVSTADAMSDPKVEAEVLNDVAHLALDVAAFLSPETVLLRLSAVFGRLCAMGSDYVTDSSMNVDELFFQLTLLAVSVTLLLKSAMPIIKATLVRTTDLDDLVYEQLFEPVGITWIQYKSIVAASCLDWMTVPPGTVLVCENEIVTLHQQGTEKEGRKEDQMRSNLYWLYRGDVIISYDGKPMSLVSRTQGKSIDDPSALGFLADMRFLYELDRKTKAQTRKRTARQRRRSPSVAGATTVNETKGDSDQQKYPMATISVGPQGATLMTVDSNRLFDLMDNDEHLSSSVRALLLKSLQRKVGELLRSRAATIDDQLQQQQDAAMAMAMANESVLWQDSSERSPSAAEDRITMPSELAP